MTSVSTRQHGSNAALISGMTCYIYWGFVPLLFQAIDRAGASPAEIVGHRTLWSVIWAGLLIAISGGANEVRQILKNPQTLGLLALSALLISTNWIVYVTAVNSHRTLDASLGYYINPLINMAAGAILFRERLDWSAKIAIGLAVVGVALQAVAIGRLPWLPLALAASFGGYGIVRKHVKTDANSSLFIECLMMAAPGGFYVFWLEQHGLGHFGHGLGVSVLLFIAAPVMIIPLALFGWAARRMPLSTMGFLQFLAPTISFAIALIEGEAFTPMRAASFAFIWIGTAIFAIGTWRAARRTGALARSTSSAGRLQAATAEG